ncbi:MAG: cell envelope protein SmpA, partial [Rhodobacteraceae bacterium]|nr:cell envelope protein SmpA [Paracoccaceae bacterium]
LSRRITESSIKSLGLIRQIFGSAGNFDPTMMLD